LTYASRAYFHGIYFLMNFIKTFRRDWLFNLRGDILAGIVVALALIPEAIGFSVIAGVDPQVGLYASFSIAVVTSVVGGRPGMVSAAYGHSRIRELIIGSTTTAMIRMAKVPVLLFRLPLNK
jgi:MFS superfamily sulfate permease-like transporter